MIGLIQRVEEFWGERLWLSFQNVRLVTAAPNPRKTVINASLDILKNCYWLHHGAWISRARVSIYSYFQCCGDAFLHESRFL